MNIVQKISSDAEVLVSKNVSDPKWVLYKRNQYSVMFYLYELEDGRLTNRKISMKAKDNIPVCIQKRRGKKIVWERRDSLELFIHLDKNKIKRIFLGVNTSEKTASFLSWFLRDCELAVPRD